MEQVNAIEKRPMVHCNVFDYCAGMHSKSDHCWEVARSKCDFQYVFNVCSECIVYLYEQGNMGMSREDIELILQKRNPAQDN